MTPGTHTANLGHDLGQLLDTAALAKLLETAQFRYLEVYVIHVAVIVTEYLYLSMTFQPGDGIDGISFHVIFLLKIEPGRLNL
jgi:hypothetical protein